MVNLAAGAYRLSGPDDGVDFDIDADGSPDRITWTARDSATAFLALDRNADAIINDGSELFGNWTMLHSGARAANGFEALKDLDDNEDGVIDAADAGWAALLLWSDHNHDGVSQPGELQRIAASFVRAVETTYHWSGRRDRYGNLFKYEALAHLETGRWPLYDVYFRRLR